MWIYIDKFVILLMMTMIVGYLGFILWVLVRRDPWQLLHFSRPKHQILQEEAISSQIELIIGIITNSMERLIKLVSHIDSQLERLSTHYVNLELERAAPQEEIDARPEISADGSQTTIEYGPLILESLDTFVKYYNNAKMNPSQRQMLQITYSPRRIGIVNASERRINPNTPPKYAAVPDGEYWAFALQDKEKQGLFAVTPRFDSVLQQHNFTVGALLEIFEIGSYDLALCYRYTKLQIPAIFMFNEPDQWVLAQKGQLVLGPGD